MVLLFLIVLFASGKVHLLIALFCVVLLFLIVLLALGIVHFLAAHL